MKGIKIEIEDRESLKESTREFFRRHLKSGDKKRENTPNG